MAVAQSEAVVRLPQLADYVGSVLGKGDLWGAWHNTPPFSAPAHEIKNCKTCFASHLSASHCRMHI